MNIQQQLIEQLNAKIIEQFGKQVTAQLQHLSNLLATDENLEKYTAEEFEEFLTDIIYSATGVDSEEIKLRKRERRIVQARQLFHYFMRENTNMSYSKIGLISGGYDHATVLYSCRTIENLNENNKDIQKVYSEIFSAL